MRDLVADQPLFVGFELDGSLRRQLDGLSGPDSKYVSADDETFLSMCRLGGKTYVGKLISDRLTTGRVDDVRRNVLSILRRVCPDVRLPEEMEILPCATGMPTSPVYGTEPGEERKSPPERVW